MQSQGHQEAKGRYTGLRRRCQSVSEEEKAEGNEMLTNNFVPPFASHNAAVLFTSVPDAFSLS